MLGLICWPDSTQAIKPDYTKTAAEVFSEAVAHLIRDGPVRLYSTFPLHALRPTQLTISQGVTDLPCWMMDLNREQVPRQDHDHACICSHYLEIEADLRDRQNNLSVIARVDRRNVLHTVGTFIGTVSGTSSDVLCHGNMAESATTDIMVESLLSVQNTLLTDKGFSIGWFLTDRDLLSGGDQDVRSIFEMYRQKKLEAVGSSAVFNFDGWGSE